jgi:hypothetical protein
LLAARVERAKVAAARVAGVEARVEDMKEAARLAL